MQKICSDDEVIVLAGKDKGKRGKVLKVRKQAVKLHNGKPVTRVTALVQGVNIVQKAVKPDPNRQVKGGIVSKEAYLDISNLALLNPTTNKPDKVQIKILENGKRGRCFKSNGEVVV